MHAQVDLHQSLARVSAFDIKISDIRLLFPFHFLLGTRMTSFNLVIDPWFRSSPFCTRWSRLGTWWTLACVVFSQCLASSFTHNPASWIGTVQLCKVALNSQCLVGCIILCMFRNVSSTFSHRALPGNLQTYEYVQLSWSSDSSRHTTFCTSELVKLAGTSLAHTEAGLGLPLFFLYLPYLGFS